MAPSLYNKKPFLITKNVLPQLAKLVEETKSEIKTATNKLLQTLYSLMGRSLVDHVPSNKAQIILDIVNE